MDDIAVPGQPARRLGRELFISEAAVKTRLTRACAQPGVSGRTAAVARALQTGARPPAG